MCVCTYEITGITISVKKCVRFDEITEPFSCSFLFSWCTQISMYLYTRCVCVCVCCVCVLLCCCVCVFQRVFIVVCVYNGVCVFCWLVCCIGVCGLQCLCSMCVVCVVCAQCVRSVCVVCAQYVCSVWVVCLQCVCSVCSYCRRLVTLSFIWVYYEGNYHTQSCFISISSRLCDNIVFVLACKWLRVCIILVRASLCVCLIM